MNKQELPRVGTIVGDPCGIGPEIIAKSWATGKLHKVSRPVLVGSAYAMQQGIDVAGVDLKLRKISNLSDCRYEQGVIDIYDSGALDPAFIKYGEDIKECGAATGQWLDEVAAFAIAGQLEATVMAPVSSIAMKKADVLDRVVNVVPGESYLMLLSGNLRVVHVTDHMPLREVCDILTPDLIEKSLDIVHATMAKWGIPEPRIAVSGLNAHAMGAEDVERIKPGVDRALAKGIKAYGPLSPDTVFRQCVDGRYDVVLAMYHDQGHIAVKTWGFSGNCVIVLGLPYLFLSVGHGTAPDIAGQGIADHSMMLSAMTTAGAVLLGKGFEQTNAIIS